MKTEEEVIAFVKRKSNQAFDHWRINQGRCNGQRYLAWEHIRTMLYGDEMPVNVVKHKVSLKIKVNLAYMKDYLKDYKTYEERAEELSCLRAETAELKSFMEFLDED